MSSRVTLGFVPCMLLASENDAWSPEAKCVVWERHSAHCSDVAQAPDRTATPMSAATVAILERITVTSCDDVGEGTRLAAIMIRNPRAPSQLLFWPILGSILFGFNPHARDGPHPSSRHEAAPITPPTP